MHVKAQQAARKLWLVLWVQPSQHNPCGSHSNSTPLLAAAVLQDPVGSDQRYRAVSAQHTPCTGGHKHRCTCLSAHSRPDTTQTTQGQNCVAQSHSTPAATTHSAALHSGIAVEGGGRLSSPHGTIMATIVTAITQAHYCPARLLGAHSTHGG